MTGFPRSGLSRLTLGTVQLGMPYGIARRAAPPDAATTQAILSTAWRHGIRCLDTAPAYGVAESRIGAWRRATGNAPLIVSKLPALAGVSDLDAPTAIRRHVVQSCAALGVTRLDGYLARCANDLARPPVCATLRRLVEEGYIAAYGASLYDVAEIEPVLGQRGVSLIQGPFSLLDGRFFAAGLPERCAASEITLFARSVFLQGALLLDSAALPRHLRPARAAIAALRALAREAGMELPALALGAVHAIAGIDSVVVGVDDPGQLETVCAAGPLDGALLAEARARVPTLPDSVLDPRRWS